LASEVKLRATLQSREDDDRGIRFERRCDVHGSFSYVSSSSSSEWFVHLHLLSDNLRPSEGADFLRDVIASCVYRLVSHASGAPPSVGATPPRAASLRQTLRYSRTTNVYERNYPLLEAIVEYQTDSLNLISLNCATHI